MKNDSSPSGPRTDEKSLEYWVLAAMVLHFLEKSEEDKKEKPHKNPFLEPVVLAAIVTVLIGGMVGSLITYILQRKGRDREYRQSILKTRGDWAISSYKENLDQEQNTVKRAYGLIGSCIAAADQLIYLNEERWRPRKTDTADDRKAIDKSWDEIIGHFAETRAKWDNEKEELGQLMDYYHPDDRQVVDAWSNLQNSVDAYFRWADDYFESNRPPKKFLPTQKIDDQQRMHLGDRSSLADEDLLPTDNRLLPRLNKFTAALKTSRIYPWKWLLSPDVEKALSNTE